MVPIVTEVASPPLPAQDAAPQRALSLGDVICLMVGTVIAAGIYEATPTIAQSVPSASWLIAVWVLGGAITLGGALCYAELATAMPEDGGDYVYLSRAFGRPLGFLFAWAEVMIVRPGSIGLVAFVFARYANELIPLNAAGRPDWIAQRALVIYAAGAILCLSLVNWLGIRQGTRTQNLLTISKLVGIAVLVGVGMLAAPPPAAPPQPIAATLDMRTALVLVILTFGGWSEMVYVGAEVQHPQRNLTRALVWGTSLITLVYLLVNFAFLRVLGFEGVAQSSAVATDVVARVFAGSSAATLLMSLVSVLICVSCLGSINGQLFAAARVGYAFGRQHRLLAGLGNWDARRGTPVVALIWQASIAVCAVVGFGLYDGDTSGFQRMVDFTTPVFYFFLTMTSLSLFVFRRRATGQRATTFRVPAYPLIPLAFTLVSVSMLISTLNYAFRTWAQESLWALGLLAIGCLLAAIDHFRAPPAHSGPPIS